MRQRLRVIKNSLVFLLHGSPAIYVRVLLLPKMQSPWITGQGSNAGHIPGTEQFASIRATCSSVRSETVHV
ncbi:hypothetical protein LY78DRAFT_661627 [Colletotrichum sublineola]|nr:hypothetical protein LY78DRAFT_661627 [Colletotrichum sublineola]